MVTNPVDNGSESVPVGGWSMGSVLETTEKMTGSAARARSDGLLVCVCRGLAYYWATSLVVFLGGAFGVAFLRKSTVQGDVFDDGQGPFYMNWDGQWFLSIAKSGYFYNPEKFSSVNFFPAYPLAARFLSALTGLRTESALLAVANLSLLATFVLMAWYCGERGGVQAKDKVSTGFCLISMGLAPPTFFFRMAYSESFFLLLTALLLVGMRRRWPLPVLAVIVGLATGTRPVGVALIPALADHAWSRQPDPRGFAVRAAYLLPLALWGVIAYSAYLGWELGEPAAFIKSHAMWDRHRGTDIAEKVKKILSLEPLWSRFDPTLPAYWVNHDHDGGGSPLFSLYLADPFYFLFAAGLVAIGMWKGWLSRSESLIAAALIAMPLLLKSYPTDMEGFGRYGFTNLPVFFVCGRLLRALSPPVAAAVLAPCVFFMGAYTAMFARWYMLL
jgi:hypothetical protein